MLFEGSRYLRVKDQAVPAPDGRPVQVKRVRPLEVPEGSFEYVAKEGDRLDLLAFRFYRTPRKWWLICDANPGVLYPDELLRPGQRIVVPPDRAV